MKPRKGPLKSKHLPPIEQRNLLANNLAVAINLFVVIYGGQPFQITAEDIKIIIINYYLKRYLPLHPCSSLRPH